MRLDKVQLINFRNHVDSTLDLEGVLLAVIIGGNHEGKSSIGQAISIGLTDTTDGLDLQGRGFIEKIRRGQSKGSVLLHVRGRHLIEQVVNLNTNSTGRTSKSRCLDDPDWHPLPFEQFLQANRDALLVALNTDYFLNSLDEMRQKKLLARLVLPDQYEFPDDKVKMVEKFLGSGVIDFNGEPFEAIDKAYSKLYQERTVINRQVRDFSIPDPLNYEGPSSELLQRQLTAKQEKKRELEAARDKDFKKYNEAQASITRLQARIEGYQTRINEEGRKLEANAARILTAAQLKKHKAVAEREKEYRQLEADRLIQRSRVEACEVEIERFEQLKDKAGAECPTCGQRVDAKHILDILESLKADRDNAANKETELWKKMQALGAIEDSNRAIAEHEIAEREKTAIDSIINEQNRLKKTAAAELENLNVPAEGPSDKHREAIGALQKEIDQVQSQLRPAISAEERKIEIDRRMQERDVIKTKARDIDELVKYFDKDGIKAQLLKEHIGAFQEKVNLVMAAWGYKCSFSIDPYEFNVTDAKGITTPVRELSGSEKHLFACALQCAVSRAAEIGIVVLDRADTFTPTERQKVNECLFEMLEQELLEQVFLIVAGEDEDREVPDIDGLAMFAVNDGKVTRLKATVAA